MKVAEGSGEARSGEHCELRFSHREGADEASEAEHEDDGQDAAQERLPDPNVHEADIEGVTRDGLDGPGHEVEDSETDHGDDR